MVQVYLARFILIVAWLYRGTKVPSVPVYFVNQGLSSQSQTTARQLGTSVPNASWLAGYHVANPTRITRLNAIRENGAASKAHLEGDTHETGKPLLITLHWGKVPVPCTELLAFTEDE